jgi:hypothetical protein
MSSSRRRTAGFPIALLISLSMPAGASAQVLRGTVIDELANRPVARARVAVMPADRDTVIISRITDDGVFEFHLPEPGAYRLRVEALGYAALTTAALEVRADGVVTVELRMRVEAIALQPLRIVAERVEPPFMRDIRYRQRLGFGNLVTREELDERTGSRLRDVLETVPGVRIVEVARRGGRPVPLVETRAAAINPRGCFAALYLNGIRQFEMGAPDPDVLAKVEELFALRPYDIEAIEVYRGAAEVPAEFSGSTAECGVVAVWLRTGHERYAETAPAVSAPRVHVSLAGAHASVSGDQAPDAGMAFEAAAYWPIWRSVSLGVSVRRSGHHLALAEATRLLRSVDPAVVALPTGPEPMTLYVLGVEPRLHLLRSAPVRPVVGGRLALARRGFDLDYRDVDRSFDFTSHGWGVGGGAGIDLRVTPWLSLDATVLREWLFFGTYRALETPGNPTAADWNATVVRVGIGYSFGAAGT